MKHRVGFGKKTLRDVPLDGQTVLVRTDYNVPLRDDGTIEDDYRIRKSLPTLRALQQRGCRIVICSHLGRPDGQPDEKYSLAPVAKRLAELTGSPVKLAQDCIGDVALAATRRQGADEIVLLENLRFHAEEEQDDEAFARALAKASRARYFVQDGFGVVHRAHASTRAITQWLPAVAGELVENEYRAITQVMQSPVPPVTAIIGGAKISDKIDVIEAFADRADHIVIGGAMANTFLKYQGHPIGKSLYEPDADETVARILARVGDKLILPVDVAVGGAADAATVRREVALDAVQPADRILDVGPRTIEGITQLISQSHTVVWNGTLGMAEFREFAHGSARTALALAMQPDIISVIGGGDTADFVRTWDAREGKSFSHVSTGGGASLELMAGRTLPGIAALLDA